MKWLQSTNQAIRYIEDNLLSPITIDDVASHVYLSSSHFQRIFTLVTGITVGEYIRNRRLSYFFPMTIQISIQGGFTMSNQLIDQFCWNDFDQPSSASVAETKKYQTLIHWAFQARTQNPSIFDKLTEWILDDDEWCAEKLIENEQILMLSVLARFKEQNAKLRAYLKGFTSPHIVNPAIFNALDCFDDELSGISHSEEIADIVSQVFSDFSLMKNRSIREIIAGSKTGPTGTDHIDIYGYINILKDCDARVQWTLFMPDMVQNQQNGFKVDSFEYKKLPAMRFIGFEGEEYDEPAKRAEKMKVLDSLSEYSTELNYDALFMHHNGLSVDVGKWHGVWGRFLKADAPVPDGFLFFDLLPYRQGPAGAPFMSTFAYATFSGDIEAMHKREGYDSDAMYDVTRNIILGQDINIPYPEKYWTAEVFLNGCANDSTAYMFSVEL